MEDQVKELKEKIEKKLIDMKESIELMYQRGEYDRIAMFDLDEEATLLADLTMELFSLA